MYLDLVHNKYLNEGFVNKKVNISISNATLVSSAKGKMNQIGIKN